MHVFEPRAAFPLSSGDFLAADEAGLALLGDQLNEAAVGRTFEALGPLPQELRDEIEAGPIRKNNFA